MAVGTLRSGGDQSNGDMLFYWLNGADADKFDIDTETISVTRTGAATVTAVPVGVIEAGGGGGIASLPVAPPGLKTETACHDRCLPTRSPGMPLATR